MLIIEPNQFFTLTGQARGSFKASVSRGEAALAFGTRKELAGGQFLDLDVLAWRIGDHLTPAFGRKLAATIMCSFSDVWLKAVHRAERDRNETIWLVALETGRVLSEAQAIYVAGKSAKAPRLIFEGVNLGFGTLKEVDQAMDAATIVAERLTFVNVSSLSAKFRSDAKAIGLALGQMLVPELDDPGFASKLAECRASREALLPKRVGP